MVSVRVSGREPILTNPTVLTEPDPRGVTLDLRGLEFVCPMDLVAIGSWAELVPDSAERELKLPPPDTASYLERMNLLQLLRCRGWEIPQCGEDVRDVLPHRLLEVTPLASAWEVEELGNQLPSLFLAGNTDREKARALHFAFGELCDNAISHSAAVPVYVAAQRYSGRTSGGAPRLELAVADGGLGVARHLRTNPRYRCVVNDCDAVRLALQEGVTGTNDDRGYGFFDILKAITEASRGEMTIQSGKAVARIPLGLKDQQRTVEELPQAVRGTRVQVRVYEG